MSRNNKINLRCIAIRGLNYQEIYGENRKREVEFDWCLEGETKQGLIDKFVSWKEVYGPIEPN